MRVRSTHPEPDILECEVKWALGSIATNKASGDDGIPAELFQILKGNVVKLTGMLNVKCCTEYVRKFGELSSGHGTGKDVYRFFYMWIILLIWILRNRII